jgi:hypothetical protein
VAELLAHPEAVGVPLDLWNAIEQRLARRRRIRIWPSAIGSSPGRWLVAAAVLIAVGVGYFTLPWGRDGLPLARAATVDFGLILNGLKADPSAAFDSFLDQYDARTVTAQEAVGCGCGCGLNLDVPEMLPGGFRLVSAYTLQFGDSPGVAARYSRNGELLGVIFHPPVLREQFGTHEDRSCLIGKHRGHAVEVGDWSLVHLTDATTCHCVLSKLNHETELPAIMAAIAPGRAGSDERGDETHSHRP